MRSLPFVLDLDESNGGKVWAKQLVCRSGGGQMFRFFWGIFFHPANGYTPED